jgi:hypothetical protein
VTMLCSSCRDRDQRQEAARRKVCGGSGKWEAQTSQDKKFQNAFLPFKQRNSLDQSLISSRPATFPTLSISSSIGLKMASDEYPSSPTVFGRIARLRGFLPLNNEDASPMVTHGNGTLTSLIKSRSTASLHTMTRRPSSVRGRETSDDEEASRILKTSRDGDMDDFRCAEERRMSAVLMGPQMRSQRLIGNSNPRYRWERYWKTGEELKTMRKPMCVFVTQLYAGCHYGG